MSAEAAIEAAEAAVAIEVAERHRESLALAAKHRRPMKAFRRWIPK
jgi:hypothetical protein